MAVAGELEDQYKSALNSRDSRPLIELIEKGVDPTLQSGETSALSLATVTDCPLLELLIQKKIDLNTKFDGGVRPLMRAVGYSNDLCNMELMLKAGADVNAVDDEGWAALVYALLLGDPKRLEMLLQAGADPKSVDANGISLHMYDHGVSASIIALLSKGGASPVDRELMANKIRITLAEALRLESAVDKWGRYNGKANHVVVTFEIIKETLEEYGPVELGRNGGVDPFGNPYIFGMIKQGVAINEKSIETVKSASGSVPEMWVKHNALRK